MLREVDVAIIGAGSAGLYALSQVRRETENYVLIDGGELGTTCARVGCMPSKVIIQVADDFHRRTIFDREGIGGADALGLDKAAVMEHVQDLRDTFVDRTLGVTDGLDDTHLIDGYARFVDDHTLEVNDQHYRAKAIVIAAGTKPIVPDAWQSFREDIITTDEFFEIEDLPASVAVIGLGSIGLELGQALSRLGVAVTGIDLLETVAKLQDPVVNKLAVDVIGKEFPLWLGEAAQINKTADGIRVSVGEKQVAVDKVLASLGRRPNLDRLGLENTSLQLDDKAVPVFDPETMQCGSSSIYIAGDVVLDRPLLHEAGHEGRVAGYNAVRQSAVKFRRKTALAITFCDPNVSTVGAQLDALDVSTIAIAEMQFAPVGRALIMGKNRGIIRVYVNKADGLVVGAAMACVKGEHLAHLLAWSIQQGMTVFDLLKMPYYHPVIEEALQGALYAVLPELDVTEETVELEKI
ncbi:MAG: dihydrolipoyl dehydrogenase [Gammaproteobacteria bacterium]|nr:dihydrolipoyl dehydrogenase [Gammaproteobacteria bacterium]